MRHKTQDDETQDFKTQEKRKSIAITALLLRLEVLRLASHANNL